jgi:hypothetical protein
MTCIVGLVHDGKVYVGGDSAGVGGYDLTVRADKKVFRNGEFVMGFTSSFRMGNLLQHALTPPRWHPDDDVHKYMVTDFVDAVRTCLKKGGYATKESEAEVGGTFLVGYAGRLFTIHGDYQVGEGLDGYAACGCGDTIALGSLYTSKGNPRSRVLTALAAAERFSAGVRAPFHIEVA